MALAGFWVWRPTPYNAPFPPLAINDVRAYHFACTCSPSSSCPATPLQPLALARPADFVGQLCHVAGHGGCLRQPGRPVFAVERRYAARAVPLALAARHRQDRGDHAGGNDPRWRRLCETSD